MIGPERFDLTRYLWMTYSLLQSLIRKFFPNRQRLLIKKTRPVFRVVHFYRLFFRTNSVQADSSVRQNRLPSYLEAYYQWLWTMILVEVTCMHRQSPLYTSFGHYHAEPPFLPLLYLDSIIHF